MTTTPERTDAGREHPCPRCGSQNVARILWGMPAWEATLEARLDAGEIALGGCVVSGDDPDYRCNACGGSFGRPRHRAPKRVPLSRDVAEEGSA